MKRDSLGRIDTSGVKVPTPLGPDSLLLRDSLRRRDSLRVVHDTVKAPLFTAEPPVLADPSGSFAWDRKDVFSTGALTLGDLLERVPGVTTMRPGWIAGPTVGAFLGDPRRLRIFLDGMELEELDPRMRAMWDVSQIPLWALDDIRIERGVSEIRVYMRSWRVNRTTPFTRTDVYSGDQGTNLYRGLFGRRYRHGEALQLAGQQYSTNPGGNAQSSDALGILGRLGVARRNWSADVTLFRNDQNRGTTLTVPAADSVARLEGTYSNLYARFAWGSTEKGPWVQGTASGANFTYGGEPTTVNTTPGTQQLADTSRFRSQYVLSAGYSAGPVRASFSQRYWAGLQQRVASPSARIGVETKYGNVSLFGEGRGLDTTRRLEAAAVFRPFKFVFLAGAIGSTQSEDDSLANQKFMRAEAGIRVGQLWFTGGVLRRDSTFLLAPTVYLGTTIDTTSGSLQGTFATIRGRIWKALYADIQGIQWNDTASFYRPRYQTRTELYISTSLLDRFPTGNFHLLASAVHEYRSGLLWPLLAGPVEVNGYRVFSTLLQFRILSAEVFWNYRNILNERYQQIPGYPQPRLINVYGVRWEFWN
ncbi:MAG TPA: hypothetical protein VFT29_15350 [Gemmatimonadaceae bacterium]|nr:hypothetical protein [Gemmatimonadaceae bacterium]